MSHNMHVLPKPDGTNGKVQFEQKPIDKHSKQLRILHVDTQILDEEF